jgi:hypothetical protein
MLSASTACAVRSGGLAAGRTTATWRDLRGHGWM